LEIYFYKKELEGTSTYPDVANEEWLSHPSSVNFDQCAVKVSGRTEKGLGLDFWTLLLKGHLQQ
jgi:hypothetical protein